MGGQVGDTGTIVTAAGGIFEVAETFRIPSGGVGHKGVVKGGMFRVGETVELKVDPEERRETCANHSATHLLHKALRTVLGTHVEQAGSYVDRDRLRFDFSHFSAMTPEEIERVEAIVNEEILRDLPVITEEMSLKDAKARGAMALFGEKYGETVRVVSMGDFSTELCGGTHVGNTARIGGFKILSEAGVAAGVRRIEALTGRGMMEYFREREALLRRTAAAAKTTPEGLEKRLAQLQEEVKVLAQENEKLKAKIAGASMGDLAGKVKEIGGVRLLAVKAEGLDMNGLRNMCDKLRNQLGDLVIVLASDQDGKVNLVVSAGEECVAKGAHAGNLIKAIAPLVGGGGGGRPNMAQAGGKNPAGIGEALAKAGSVLAGMLKT